MAKAANPLMAWGAQLPPNLQGAGWMLLSGLSFTLHLSFVKMLSDDFSSSLIAFFRAFAGLILIAPLLARAGASVFHMNNPGLILLRGTLTSFGFLLSFAAVGMMPISQFNAISFSRPLIIIVLAAIFLREVIGPRRWIATAVGLLGVLIIVRPTTQLEPASLMALTAAACYAGAIVLVKVLSRNHSTLTMIVYTNIISTLILTPFAIIHWVTPDMHQLFLIILMAITATGSQAFYIKGMAAGEASFVSNMDFLRLPMAVVADWVLFKSLPDKWVWPGVIIIIASTLYISFRDAQRRTQSQEAPQSTASGSD